jgi:hypothetical protein
LGEAPGFFRFGRGITCFGRNGRACGRAFGGEVPDVSPLLQVQGNEIGLPFEVNEVIENLRRERYVLNEPEPTAPEKLVRRAYYVARHFLP